MVSTRRSFNPPPPAPWYHSILLPYNLAFIMLHYNPFLQVEVILDPACVYTVTVSSDGFRTAANLIRYQYDKLGGCLLFAVLSLCVHVIQGEVPSLIHSVSVYIDYISEHYKDNNICMWVKLLVHLAFYISKYILSYSWCPCCPGACRALCGTWLVDWQSYMSVNCQECSLVATICIQIVQFL